MYAKRFAKQRHTSTATIVGSVYPLRGTGSVILRYDADGFERSRTVLQAEEETLNIAEANSRVSTTNLPRRVNVFQTTVEF